MACCQDADRIRLACSSLQDNHRQITRIEKELASLSSKPFSEKMEKRKAYLEKQRRMLLASNDLQKPECHTLF